MISRGIVHSPRHPTSRPGRQPRARTLSAKTAASKPSSSATSVRNECSSCSGPGVSIVTWSAPALVERQPAVLAEGRIRVERASILRPPGLWLPRTNSKRGARRRRVLASVADEPSRRGKATAATCCSAFSAGSSGKGRARKSRSRRLRAEPWGRIGSAVRRSARGGVGWVGAWRSSRGVAKTRRWA
jgi:hypothetical protein